MSTGRKAHFEHRCPPKGSLLEPLCNLRDSPIPSFEFGPGPLLFSEPWSPQPLGPSNIFGESWSFSALTLGTPQFVEPWELMTFVLGPTLFSENWDSAAHTWFKSEYFGFGTGGGGGG